MNSRFKNIILNFLALMIGCFIVIVMFVTIETVLYFKNIHKESQQKDDGQNIGDFIVSDPLLGTKNLAGFEGIHYCRIHGKEIFSSEYRIDDKGRRITPVDAPESRDRAALFFGCSHTFGFGVEQDETLPAYFGQICKQYIPVNYAVGGYGPQNMWLKIQEPDFKHQVPRDKGVAVYCFIHHHLDRLMGESTLVSQWGELLPWLDINELGVQYMGLMSDREEQRSFIVKSIQSFHTGCFALETMRRFHAGLFLLNRLNLLPYTEEDATKTLACLLADTQEKLAEILPGYKFIVCVYPLSASSRLVNVYLDQYKVPCFFYGHRYHELNMDIDFKDYLFTDQLGQEWGHPKAVVYADTAKWLAEDLDRCYGICGTGDAEKGPESEESDAGHPES